MPRGLPSRSPAVERIAEEAARKAYRLVIKQLSSDGNVQAEGKGGDVMQQEDLDRVTPWGFDSVPPADSEGVAIPCEGADVIVGERRALASGVPSSSGSSSIFSNGGGYVHVSNGGNITAEPEAGKFVLLGDGATHFVADATKVFQALTDIKAWADAHTHNDPVSGVTDTPNSTFTVANTSATKAKVE